MRKNSNPKIFKKILSISILARKFKPKNIHIVSWEILLISTAVLARKFKVVKCKLHKSEGKTNPEWLRLLLILFTVAFPVTFTLIALVLLQLALILAMVVFGSLVKKSVWTTTRKTNPATLDTQNKSFFKANISMLETQLRRIHFGFGRQKVTSLII